MKRRRWTIIGSVVLSAAVLGTCGVSCVRLKGPTPRQVERQIRADVPLGTPRAAVEDYLRGRGIEFVAVNGSIGDQRNNVPVVDLAGLGDRAIGWTVRAYVEPAFVDPLWAGEVKVYFYFDGAGLLIGYAFLP